MKHIVKHIAALVIVVCWLAGIVLAHGMISVLVAMLFPPYAWYLVIEHIMMFWGLA